MACLLSREENVIFQICLSEIVEKEKNEFETWVYTNLELKSSVLNCSFGKQENLTLNKTELDELFTHLNTILDCLENKRDYSFDFSNYESDFEIKMCTSIVDEAIEVEVWINWGNYTRGEEVGYDAGIRFVVDLKALKMFVQSLNEEKKGIHLDGVV